LKNITQHRLAKELGISNSYLCMLLSGKRKVTQKLMNKLQLNYKNIHKIVNKNDFITLFTMLEHLSYTQGVIGSNPIPPTMILFIPYQAKYLIRHFYSPIKS
jgi:hypothetical protein